MEMGAKNEADGDVKHVSFLHCLIVLFHVSICSDTLTMSQHTIYGLCLAESRIKRGCQKQLFSEIKLFE